MDREKVIRGLEHCISEGDCRGCPYFKVILDSKIICPCREDALALLKEQEEEIENLKQTCQSMMEGIYLLKDQKANGEVNG